MALTTPSSVDEVIDRAVNDVFLALQEFGAKPSLKNSWLNSLIVAYSNRIFDFYFALDQAALEALPDTAVDNLERWATIWGVRRIPGVQSEGTVVATGTVGSTIGKDVVLTSGAGKEYTVDAAVAITTKSLSVFKIERVGTVATLTTTAPHDLTDAVKITVTGAVETEYNVTLAEIVVTGASTLTYTVAGSPSTPATGTILLGADTATLTVTSVAFEDESDQDGLAGLTLESPIVGVDDTIKVDFLGLNDGADRETDDALRVRLLDRIQNPVAHFNVADIRARALTVPGVTRVFVQEITPDVGQVTVYFMRDLDETGTIPDGPEIATLKAELDLIRPANTAPQDLIVLAPTAVSTDFDFTALDPNTDPMKTAVRESLEEFFANRTTLGVAVTEDEYRSAIFNTTDPTTGAAVISFSLSTPSGPIPVANGEIATLGSITGIS